jgi:hypothetical protein
LFQIEIDKGSFSFCSIISGSIWEELLLLMHEENIRFVVLLKIHIYWFLFKIPEKKLAMNIHLLWKKVKKDNLKKLLSYYLDDIVEIST